MSNLSNDDFKFTDLMGSILIASFLGMLLSHNLTFSLTDSNLRDGSLMIQSRPLITVEALNTITSDNTISIVGTGSSMTFKGLDGKCVSENMSYEANVYNIAQLNSYPWNDMIHIPRLVNSNPDVVLIEIGPNLLKNLSSQKAIENSKFRYRIDTSQQDSSDIGGWIELIHPKLENFVATNDIDRIKLRQEYVTQSIEEKLNRFIFNESNARNEWTYGWTPHPESEDWIEYLQTPSFPPDRYGFEGMDTIERLQYNETKMDDSAGYKPEKDSYGYLALEYEISTLVENGISIIIIGLPHHPSSIDSVPHAQWDSVNQTMNDFSQMKGVTVFNQIWEPGWIDEHFYDRNHLDDEGRVEFCNRLAPVIDEVLSGRGYGGSL